MRYLIIYCKLYKDNNYENNENYFSTYISCRHQL